MTDSFQDDIQHPRGALAKIEHILTQTARKNGKDGISAAQISLGELSDAMEERAFGLLLLILALPCGLPFVYIIPQIVALPMVVLALQLASGRNAPWLPAALRNRKLPVAGLLDVLKRTKRYAGWLEKLVHPRLSSFTDGMAARLVGALLVIPSISILVPLPLTNTVPGIGVAIASVGLIERDGLFVIGGLVLGLAWVALLLVGGTTALSMAAGWLFGH